MWHRFLSVWIALILITVTLASCVAALTEAPTPILTPTPEPTEAPPDPSESMESVVARLQRGEPLRAGVKIDAPPWGYLDEGGNHAGFDIELVKAMAERWGVEVEFVQVTSADRLEKLAAGEIDLVAASMTHRRDREEFADFSITYFLDGQALLVKAESGIASMADLDGKVVSATRGTTGMDDIRATAGEQGVELAVVEVADHLAGVEEVMAGTVDAHITDASILGGLAKQTPGLAVVGGPLSFEPYGFGVPQNDSAFRDLVNFTLQDIYQDGTYAALYETWLLGGHPDGIDVGGDIFQIDPWPAGSVVNYVLER